MFVDELLVDLALFDNVTGDVVQDREIGLGLENDGYIGEIETTVLERG